MRFDGNLQAEPGVEDDEYSDYEEMPEIAIPLATAGIAASGVAGVGSKRKPGGAAGGQPSRRGRR